MSDSLSILIPARNEMFLKRTIEDILQNMRGDNTEIIAVLDGQWADPPIPDHPKVTLIYNAESIGQRAATNQAARYSRSKFIMKCDAHCAFDEGFDVKLMETFEYDWTVIPSMRNLHAYNWTCLKCKHEWYQGPTPKKCEKCGSIEGFERKMYWQPRSGTTNNFMRFDKDLHFQYWRDYKSRPEAQGDIVECMSLLGACWMLHRDRYWDLEGMDEEHGSWGQMGTEVSCKAWLSGGKLMVNKKTWFAHMFRTQGEDFGFPYPLSGRQVEQARKRSNEIWKGNKWPKAKRPFSWLIQKFAPIPGWGEEDITAINSNGPAEEAPAEETAPVPLVEPVVKEIENTAVLTKGIVFYTDNRLNVSISSVVQSQLKMIAEKLGIKIISVSLAPLNFGHNIVLPLERGILTMTKQILVGLEAIDSDIVYFCEHDLVYHPSHFDFTPPKTDVYYYNENTWKVRSSDGQAVFFHTKQTSGCCSYRKLLASHYRKRVERIENGEFSRKMGFEPGCHHLPNGVDNFLAEKWMSPVPNVDIRHEHNLTWSRFKPDQYRSPKSIVGWTLADEIPGWGRTKDRMNDFLNDIKEGRIGR